MSEGWPAGAKKYARLALAFCPDCDFKPVDECRCCPECGVGPDDECESGCGVSDNGGVGASGADAGEHRADRDRYRPEERDAYSAGPPRKLIDQWERFKDYHSVRDVATASRIIDMCDEIKQILLDKNKAYGDSALQPLGVFSKGVAREQLSVRIDDKLSRIQRGSEYPGDDTILDLIGYLILYRIATNQEGVA